MEIVSFYPEGTSEYDRIAGLAAEFEELNPGVTTTLTFGGGQDVPQIQARWTAGDPPEVNLGFLEANTETGGAYVEAGQVLSLSDAMAQELPSYGSTWQDAVLPGVLPLLTVPADGNVYGAPESVTTLQFFYNEAIFEEYGIEVPQTIDELVTAADTLREAGQTPFTVTGTFLAYMQMYWDYLALRHIGYDNVRAAMNGDVELATLPGAAEAAAALEDLTQEGNFVDGFRGIDFTSAQVNFFQGNAAMILMGSWLLGEMADSIPEGFEVGTFPFPAVDGAAVDSSGIFGFVNTYVVAAESENPEAGVAFLQFLADKENQIAMVETAKSISAYSGVPAPEGFESVTAALEEGATFAPSYMGIFGDTPEVQAAYQEPIAKLFFNEISGEQMLAEMSERLLAANG
ncbi:ABC transporter substrate-binding protein [Microcella sp.]|uniref:ABC transporter substrate-binding protein n=1 Tax=Microcella sp. TaxID=1913979 RepID=UPI00256CC137|nr:extracellular solute-binding protein [Microcella sp.]MBX9471928.1 extracellular solute-binding protein [Microcella sp.]